MPVVPSPALPPMPSIVFWSTEDVLNFARLLINDMQGGVAGQELADTQPYTWILLNLAYGNLLDWMEDTNVEAVTYAEAIVGPLTASGNSAFDPNTQVRLGYDGYWDGTNDTNPDVILPGDMLQPLEVWERPSGSVQDFLPMKQRLGGMPSRWLMGMPYGSARLGMWEFRGNNGVPAMYFPGIGIDTEIRIRYIPSLATLAMNPDGTFPQIPLARAGEALGYEVAALWLEIRGAANAPRIRMQAESKKQVLSNKSAKRENATPTRARGYGFNRRRR